MEHNPALKSTLVRCPGCKTGLMQPGEVCPECGLVTVAPTSEPKSLIDGRYRLVGELGHGGMGVVYLARDVGLKRLVALKMINALDRWVSPVMERFQTEAISLAAVRSPHIVQVYAFGHHSASHFFVMEYVRGRNLSEIIAEHKGHGSTIPLHRALTILQQAAEGIAAVHAAGLLHLDIKPANIVIEEDTGRPVLIDFGLAVRDDGTYQQVIGGTPTCMAPEQTPYGKYGRRVSTRTDVYAFGCTAYQVLTGRGPFADNDRQKLIQQQAMTRPPSVSTFKPELGALDSIIARALAKDPAERYESCSAFVNALVQAESGSSTEIRFSSMQPKPGESDDKLNVLVVDDDPVFRKFSMRAVQIAFYRVKMSVTTAATGTEAILLVQQKPVDLILLDFDMPGLDGIETLSRIRALPWGGHARVIVHSARVTEKERWRFSVLGVNDFFAKPVDFEALVAGIQAIAKRASWPLAEDGDGE